MVRRYASKVWTDTVPCSDHELKRPKRKGSQGNLSRTRFPRLQYQNTTDTKEPWTFNACVGYGATLYLQLTCYVWQLWLRPPRCFPSHDRPHPMPPSFYRLPRQYDNTRQECDKEKDEAMWLIASPGLSTRIQCVLRMRMPSCTSIQCQSNTSAQVSHQTVQSSPNHKSAQGETSQPPPSSNTCTLLLTVWHNMIKWYKMWPFNSVHNCSHRMTCLLLLSASRNRLLKSIRKPLCRHHRSLAGTAHGRSHKGSLGFYIAVLRRADLYLLGRTSCEYRYFCTSQRVSIWFSFSSLPCTCSECQGSMLWSCLACPTLR